MISSGHEHYLQTESLYKVQELLNDAQGSLTNLSILLGTAIRSPKYKSFIHVMGHKIVVIPNSLCNSFVKTCNCFLEISKAKGLIHEENLRLTNHGTGQ